MNNVMESISMWITKWVESRKNNGNVTKLLTRALAFLRSFFNVATWLKYEGFNNLSITVGNLTLITEKCNEGHFWVVWLIWVPEAPLPLIYALNWCCKLTMKTTMETVQGQALCLACRMLLEHAPGIVFVLNFQLAVAGPLGSPTRTSTHVDLRTGGSNTFLCLGISFSLPNVFYFCFFFQRGYGNKIQPRWKCATTMLCQYSRWKKRILENNHVKI